MPLAERQARPLPTQRQEQDSWRSLQLQLAADQQVKAVDELLVLSELITAAEVADAAAAVRQRRRHATGRGGDMGGADQEEEEWDEGEDGDGHEDGIGDGDEAAGQGQQMPSEAGGGGQEMAGQGEDAQRHTSMECSGDDSEMWEEVDEDEAGDESDDAEDPFQAKSDVLQQLVEVWVGCFERWVAAGCPPDPAPSSMQLHSYNTRSQVSQFSLSELAMAAFKLLHALGMLTARDR